MLNIERAQELHLTCEIELIGEEEKICIRLPPQSVDLLEIINTIQHTRIWQHVLKRQRN